MSLRTVLVIVLSLTCGLSAAIGVNRLGDSPESAANETSTTPIVVAAVSIPRGVTITEDQLAAIPWPKELVPSGAFTTVEEVIDRAVLSALVKDEPILSAKVAARDAGRGMAPLIPTGMRAFTIRTPDIASGVAGFILPGNYVDILLTVTRGVIQDDITGGGSTSTLLQHIEILAVDQELDAPSTNKVDPKELRSVTLLVTPDQAAKLSLAQTKGTLHLSLRNDADDTAAETRPVTLKELRFLEEELVKAGPASEHIGTASEPVAQRRPQPMRIRTLRGSNAGVIYVQPAE